MKSAKNKTGYAILGNPLPELIKDPKFVLYQEDAIASGEALAFAALSSEYLVLSVAGVPEKELRQFIGRSQFPKFTEKPLVRKHSYIKSFSSDRLHVLALAKTWF